MESEESRDGSKEVQTDIRLSFEKLSMAMMYFFVAVSVSIIVSKAFYFALSFCNRNVISMKIVWNL